MKNKRFRAAIGLILLTSILLQPVVASTPTDAYLARFFKLYDYTLSQDVQRKMTENFTPVKLSCGEVEVTLSEVLYDGHWLYTASSAVPINKEKTLVLPDSAYGNDLLKGSYNEGERDDTRTFAQAAMEDDKKLLRVSIYPKEFDSLDVYFKDYLQLAKDQSILLSGAPLPSNGKPITLTWGINIEELDKKVGGFTLIESHEHPIIVTPIGPLSEKTYSITSSKPVPFEEVTLLETGLTVYVRPRWTDRRDEGRYDFVLLDHDQKEVSSAIPHDAHNYDLKNITGKLYLKLYDHEKDFWSEPLPLILAEEEAEKR